MPSELLIIFGCSILMSLNFAIETIAYQLRCTGAALGNSSLGYSLHVQVATFARTLNFVALPLMGWLIDSGVKFERFLLVPVIFSLIFSVLCSLYLMYPKKDALSISVFKFLVSRISKIELSVSGTHSTDNKKTTTIKSKDKRKLFKTGAVASFFTIFGSLLPFILASYVHSYRATMLQMAPVFTAIGTLLSVTYFDPRVSLMMRDGFYNIEIMRTIIISKVAGVACMGVVSLAWLIYISMVIK